MKTIIRNFLSVLRRFKMATLLNILGLSVAFAAFMVIMMQVRYERNFDKCHPTSGRVFRVTLQEPGIFSVVLPRGFVEEMIHSSPYIEAGTILNFSQNPTYFTYQKQGEKIGIKEAIRTCHPDMIKVFGFTILSGDPECLNDPEKIIIPESLAQRLFGDQSAIGKSLNAEEAVWTKNRTDFTIGAVYRDFPENTQLSNSIYSAIDRDFMVDNFSASNFSCFLLLNDPASADKVEDNFNKAFDFSKIDRPDEKVKLVALTDIYYLNEGLDERITQSGSREMTNLLIFIALLVIAIAVINYINFSTSLTPVRIKSINTQKVLGSPDRVLRISLHIEAVMISLISWLLSVFMVWLLGAFSVLPFISADLSLTANVPIVLLSVSIALITGIIAGTYPARYMTSFSPALVLKGNFGLSASGRKLRTGLIGFQFIVSIILIIGASLVQLQNVYMRQYSLGFDKDQIAIVQLSSDIYNKYHETYVNRLKEHPGIADIAFSREIVASGDSYNTFSCEYKGKEFQSFLIPVSYNFFSVMGVPVTEGRDFTSADEKSDEATYIFNKVAHENLDMKAGDLLENWLPGRIAGFTGNVKFSSLRHGSDNIAFVVANKVYSTKPVSYIRLEKSADLHVAISHIRKILVEIDPVYPFQIEFYDSIFDQLYRKEVSLRSLVTLFSLLAIVLSLVGVFGLVVFETQYRRKEIAVRRVHGATVMEILKKLNKNYIYIVSVCFVMATPVAYYFIVKWQENFAYKTPLYWWIFALAFLLVTFITIATVTFQSWRAANANPVDSLKTE